MDKSSTTANPNEPLDPQTPVEQPVVDGPLVEETSIEYLGRWNRLVSTTNWEKGRIISEWRESLLEAGAPRPVLPTRPGAGEWAT